MKLIKLENQLSKLKYQIMISSIFTMVYFNIIKKWFYELFLNSLFSYFVLALLLGIFTLHLVRFIICIINIIRKLK